MWPDGAMTMFHGEKGTTWEGGFRIRMMVRWPSTIKPGSVSNEIISLMDWFPTLAAAAGEPDIKGKMTQGFKANGKDWFIWMATTSCLTSRVSRRPALVIGCITSIKGEPECHPLARLEGQLCHFRPR